MFSTTDDRFQGILPCCRYPLPATGNSMLSAIPQLVASANLDVGGAEQTAITPFGAMFDSLKTRPISNARSSFV